MILQLDPVWPVTVTGIKNGKGYAMAIIDYSQDHDLYFVVAMDDSGEIWTLNNKNVRLQSNITLGRGAESLPKSVMGNSIK